MIESEDDYFMRMPEVMRRTGISRSEVYRRMRMGSFPKATKLSERIAVWRYSEIVKWRLRQLSVEDIL